MTGESEMMENRAADRTRPSGRFAREISLWALLSRSSIYQILTIVVIMAAGEGILFYTSLNRQLARGRLTDSSFETFFSASVGTLRVFNGYDLLFLTAFGLVCLVLNRCSKEHSGSLFGYTLNRLRVTGRHLFLVRTAYNFLCLVLLMGVQVWVVLWMCRMYADSVPGELVSPQLELLAFYRVPFLHNLLPLAEIWKWVRNLLILLTISMDAANQSRRVNSQILILDSMVILAILWSVADIGFQVYDLTMAVIYIPICLGSAMRGLGIWGRDKSIMEQSE